MIYHFKGLQLKRALIRLALPLDSHSLRVTSTDLCVSIQQSVHVYLFARVTSAFVNGNLLICACMLKLM